MGKIDYTLPSENLTKIEEKTKLELEKEVRDKVEDLLTSHLTLEQKISQKFDEEWGEAANNKSLTLADINLKNSEMYKHIENQIEEQLLKLTEEQKIERRIEQRLK